MTRQSMITSLVAMFNEIHQNATAPAWLIEMHHRSSDAELIARLGNWQRELPETFARHGLYVM